MDIEGSCRSRGWRKGWSALCGLFFLCAVILLSAGAQAMPINEELCEVEMVVCESSLDCEYGEVCDDCGQCQLVDVSDPKQLCEGWGHTWDEMACGHYQCGVPNSCEAIIPGCDCGPMANFEEGLGCVQVDECICSSSGGTWEPSACGDAVCGVPNDCEADLGGCNCGPTATFQPGFACVAVQECCEDSGGTYEPAGDCPHVEPEKGEMGCFSPGYICLLPGWDGGSRMGDESGEESGAESGDDEEEDGDGGCSAAGAQNVGFPALALILSLLFFQVRRRRFES